MTRSPEAVRATGGVDIDRLNGFAGKMFDVVVVGSGVVGLTSAVRLGAAGARVAVVAADPPAATVSKVAAAVWYPTHTRADPRVLAWAARTFDELAGQAVDGVPGVVLRPTRMLLREPTTGPPWWAGAVRDFRAVEPAGLPPSYVGQWLFTVPTVEMTPYLDWLVQRVHDVGGVLLSRRLDRLAELAGLAPVVVNASGLGAGALAADPTVYPIRGQVVLVRNPGLHTSVRDEDDPAGPTYIHPRSRDVVLGGTFEPHQWSTVADPGTAAAIVKRCTALVPELAGAPMLGHLAGLRPARTDGPRVEVDPVGLPDGARLIHNYGHAGAGVTLGWGCADEVTVLVSSGWE